MHFCFAPFCAKNGPSELKERNEQPQAVATPTARMDVGYWLGFARSGRDANVRGLKTACDYVLGSTRFCERPEKRKFEKRLRQPPFSLVAIAT